MIEFLKEIVKQATKLTHEHFEVYDKGNKGDLVTNLDIKVEEFLMDKIRKKYPDYDIVSEEFNSKKQVTNNCFIIDPIDGTKNFANDMPLWAIQIACVKDGKTIASVISVPKLNELYWADETGAYLNGKRIHVRQVPINKAFYSIDGTDFLQIVHNMKQHTLNFRRFGCLGVAMAFVAIGRIHGTLFVHNKPWDYEPGLYLVKQAGGSIESVDGFHGGAMNKEFLDILKNATLG